MDTIRKKFETELLKILLNEDQDYLYSQDEVINIFVRVFDEIDKTQKFKKPLLHQLVDEIGEGATAKRLTEITAGYIKL